MGVQHVALVRQRSHLAGRGFYLGVPGSALRPAKPGESGGWEVNPRSVVSEEEKHQEERESPLSVGRKMGKLAHGRSWGDNGPRSPRDRNICTNGTCWGGRVAALRKTALSLGKNGFV